MFDAIKETNTSHTEKEIWDLLNHARNFFKHDSKNLEDKIQFDDRMNDFQLFSACHDCAVLCGAKQSPEVQVYNIWYMATNVCNLDNVSPQDIAEAKKIEEILDAKYPKLRTEISCYSIDFATRNPVSLFRSSGIP